MFYKNMIKYFYTYFPPIDKLSNGIVWSLAPGFFFFFSQKVDHKTLFFLTVSKRLRNLTMVNRVLKYTRQVKSNIILNLVKRSFPSEWYDWPRVLSYKFSFEIEIAKQFDKKNIVFCFATRRLMERFNFQSKNF